MPTKISFIVRGELPPKKHGEKSMWDQPVEAKRLAELRTAALEAMAGHRPFSRSISLTLDIHVGPRNGRAAGDLDNFVTGVCDGLQRAHPRAMIDAIWANSDLRDVHPSVVVAIIDDSEIVSIKARKSADKEEAWYRVELEGDSD